MKKNQVARLLALGLGLGAAGLTDGCGPAPLSPAEQTKVDTAIQKEHAGRHQEVKAAQKLQAADLKDQGGSRRAAHKRP